MYPAGAESIARIRLSASHTIDDESKRQDCCLAIAGVMHNLRALGKWADNSMSIREEKAERQRLYDLGWRQVDGKCFNDMYEWYCGTCKIWRFLADCPNCDRCEHCYKCGPNGIRHVKTEAWWVCNACQKPLKKAKSGGLGKAFDDHRKLCPKASGSIKQLPQGSGGPAKKKRRSACDLCDKGVPHRSCG